MDTQNMALDLNYSNHMHTQWPSYWVA